MAALSWHNLKLYVTALMDLLVQVEGDSTELRGQLTEILDGSRLPRS